MVRNALLWSVMYPSQVRLLQTTAFVTLATAAPGGSLLRKNNGRQSSLCTYLTFRAQAEAMAPPGGEVCSFLICISNPWSWLFTYVWNSSVQRVAGDQNNQIKIKPMINLPGASNCICFSLKADQSQGPTVLIRSRTCFCPAVSGQTNLPSAEGDERLRRSSNDRVRLPPVWS